MSVKTSEANGCDCQLCKKPFNQRNFYKSNSKISAYNGYLTTCKDCINEKYELYTQEYHSSKKAIQRICMAYDIYYSEKIYEKCAEKEENVTFSKYIQKTNMFQHIGKTFDNSLEEGFYFTGCVDAMDIGLVQTDGDPVINPKLIEKWGNGFSSSDYDELEKHYSFLKSSNPKCDNNQEIFIIDLCYTKMQQIKAVKEGRIDDYNKLTESYRKSFTQAGLKTIQEVDIGSDDCWGEWVRRVENYTPSEYYKNKSLFRDFDNIGEYFRRFVLRPLRNLMHGTIDRDEEFCVNDGDEDEYSEPT